MEHGLSNRSNLHPRCFPVSRAIDSTAASHAGAIFDVSAGLLMMIEIVDSDDKIRAYISQLGNRMGLGLGTVENAGAPCLKRTPKPSHDRNG